MLRRSRVVCVWATLAVAVPAAGAAPARSTPSDPDAPPLSSNERSATATGNGAKALEGATSTKLPRVPEPASLAPMIDLAPSDLVLPAKAATPPPFKLAGSRFSLIEMPAEVSPFGTKRRAHHAIGIRSHLAENWLREQGLPVNNCQLPMLRLHSRVAPSGAANATLWMYARCSLR